MNLPRWFLGGALLLLANTLYLAMDASPTVFYMGNVLVHVVLGVGMAGAFVWFLWRRPELRGPAAWLLLGGAMAGAVLGGLGNLRENWWLLALHIGLAAGGVAAIAGRRTMANARGALLAAAALMAVMPLVQHYRPRWFPRDSDRIRNPKVVPLSMEEEGGGPQSPFWPSSAKTNVGGTIPSDFFLDSKLCGECHKDIYEQWNSSAHHFASFNNQFYRKSIEHMQSLSGTKGSKWCAGCHDHAVFFNGRFDQPIEGQIDTPEAQAGLGCVSCHSITHVDGSMGNGGFTIEYPKLHELAASRNPLLRRLDAILTYLDPEPHRRTFLKPFMRLDAAEYCSACHKVHLDVPVNNYRWLRGFNDYDAWQSSGVSGQGARSFYYPAQSSTCTDCHMPLVPSKDPGNRKGMVHSHRFPGANMALAHVNQDAQQARVTEEFLKSGFITVDIFAAMPVDDTAGQPQMRRRGGEVQQAMSTFAIGEEAEHGGPVMLRDMGRLAAPLDRTATRFRPGDEIRVDVVVRTRKIGHFFPGGTVDAFDVWLELEGFDGGGRRIFWSGLVQDDGRGPVEPGAHFYRSFMLDGEGNPVNKRNAWQARSLLYVRLIPPGAADVAHYRVRLPADATGPIRLRAKLNYRKFSHYYTQFAYAGQPTGGEANVHHDSRRFSFAPANIPRNVSGQIRDRIPDLPIVVLAQAETTLQLAAAHAATNWAPIVRKEDRERWNDWGIGLLLQGDLRGAEYGFRRVTEADPGYADGWLNVARALIQEGQTDAARPFVDKALQLAPGLGRAYFFRAMIQKAEGDYDGALASLNLVAGAYPRDRVVHNQIGRLHFLKRDYKAAVDALQKVLAIDPEDVQAHYTLMLAFRGLGRWEDAAREEKLFRRFKADESSQTLTARQRQMSAEDNNERQMIHDHENALATGALASGGR